MHYIFLLGKESFNCYNFLLYNLTNALLESSTNTNIVYITSILNKSKNHIIKNSNKTSFFNVKLPNFGPITYLIYDIISLIHCIRYVKKNKLQNSSIFLSSTRIGIFLPFFIKKIKKLNVSLYTYCERDSIEKNIWTLFAKNIWEKSEYFCVKYAKTLIAPNSNLKYYFSKNYKNINPKIVNLNLELSTFDSIFESFLKKFNINIHNYYLLIDDFKITNTTNYIIDNFLKLDSTKKLIILSKKNSLLYKYSVANLDFFKDKRIICINKERFINLIPHLSTYCHAYIHSSINAINNKNYFKNNNINLVLESPLNSNTELTNALYFNEKSFLDILKKVDKMPIKNSTLKNTNVNILNLINILEDTLTK